jgi:hypothetical protein
MNWKQDLEALIESTMAFAKDVKRDSNREPIPDLPIALKTAEQALAETPKPVEPPTTITPIVLPASERDEIRRRASNFRAHQEKMAREREHHYLQVKARMMPPRALVDPKENPAA